MNHLPQQMFLHLLSDPKFRPAALQLIPAAEASGLAALLTQPRLAELAARIPCVVGADDAARLPPPVLDAARLAGCRILEAGAIRLASSLAEAAAAPGVPGVAYLAGDWYMQAPAKPTGDRMGSRSLALKLVQLVANDADTHEIEDIFRHDPSLSYHLLRLVNSPGMGSSRQITSFAQAIIILGRRQLRRWLNLILFAARKDDERAAMLLARVTVRARNLELLVRESGGDKERQERAFMAGMFSLLGVLFGAPIATILQPLNLDAELAAAVLHREGELGRLLSALEAGERGDAAALRALAGDTLPAGTDLDLLQIEACLWMLELIHDSAGNANG